MIYAYVSGTHVQQEKERNKSIVSNVSVHALVLVLHKVRI